MPTPTAAGLLAPTPIVARLIRDAARLAPTLPCQHPERRDWWTSESADAQEAAAHGCMGCPLLARCSQAFLTSPARTWTGVVLGGYAATPSRQLGAADRRREVGLPLVRPGAKKSGRRPGSQQGKPRPPKPPRVTTSRSTSWRTLTAVTSVPDLLEREDAARRERNRLAKMRERRVLVENRVAAARVRYIRARSRPDRFTVQMVRALAADYEEQIEARNAWRARHPEVYGPGRGGPIIERQRRARDRRNTHPGVSVETLAKRSRDKRTHRRWEASRREAAAPTPRAAQDETYPQQRKAV